MSRFYISAFGELPRGGIYTCELKENGEVIPLANVPFYHSGYLAWNSNKTRLYATGGLDDEKSDCLAAFSVNEDGFPVLLNTRKSHGKSCCHLGVSPDDKFVYAANYFSGNFSEYAILEDGSLSEALQVIQHEGSGPHPERQTSAHAHFCGFSPDGRFLLVIDLGIDAVMAYPYTPGKGISRNGVIRNRISPGSGPRHLVFDSSGKIAYLVTELGNTVKSLHYNEGHFEFISEISLLPCRIEYPTKAAAVRLSADERFLLATNRGFDSVAVIALDGAGGMVLNDLTLSGGISPRDLNFLGNDRFVAVGNEFSGNVYFFDFNRESGKLTPNGYKLELPRPLCFTE
jgi:6-phosphogluconolactonase